MPPGNATEQSSLPKYRDLHAEFRTILKLTELVSAINNSGHMTLRLPREAYTLTPLLDVLLAITTLLVRDHEVVALGILGKNIVAVQQQTIASMPILTNKDEDFMGELHFDEDLDCSNICVNNIAAVVNPRVGDKYDIPDGNYCIVVDTGKSLLVANMLKGKEGWRYLDKLRCDHHLLYLTSQGRITYGPYQHFA
jgi:predicted lipoprotein with Yx(FWY)xxD motif